MEQRFAASAFQTTEHQVQNVISVIWAGEQGNKQLAENLDNYIKTLKQSGS